MAAASAGKGMSKPKFIFLLMVMFISLITTASPAAAHAMPSSMVSLDLNQNDVTAELILPLDRLEISYGKTLTEQPEQSLLEYEQELKAYIQEHVYPTSSDGQAWSVMVVDMSLQLEQQPYDLIVNLRMIPPAGAPVDQFTFNYDVIVHQLVTHSVMVYVRNDWNHAVTAGNPVLLGTLRADVVSLEVNQSGGSWWTGFGHMVQLGISHIAEGIDHLLFLVVLLLPAPLLHQNKRWTSFAGIRLGMTQLLRVVTAFTIGHSLTLMAGALEWIPGTSQWIEMLIACSILVSAVHAIRPLFPGREALIALGFGLIHGMAFASLIDEIGLNPWNMASSILAFNVGIELMQLFVITITMPWLLLLSVTAWYKPIRVAGALLAIVASAAWLLERATLSANPVSEAVNAASPYAVWLVIILALLALVVTTRRLILNRFNRKSCQANG